MSNNLTLLAKDLRKNSTEAEKLVWKHLRAKQFNDLKFRRQQPIGRYIVDFVCFSKRIVIELDGGHHLVEKDKDNERDRWLESQGFRVLRFWNNEVFKNIEGVLLEMSKYCS